MNNTAAHSKLVADIRLALGMERDLVLWLNRVTHVETYDAIRGGAVHGRAGLPDGSPDLVGIFKAQAGGIFVGLEVKTGAGKQRPAQLAFQQVVRHLGGVYAVVRSVAEARDVLEQLRVRWGTAA